MSAHSITSRGLAGRKIPQGTLTPMGALLFSASEQGAWYDPSDMSTLFQDSAGTTPVTAVEQPVGRMLDKSGRGNHAIQATTTARPVLSARVNELLATTTLATQSVTTRAASYRLVFSGAGSVTLSGTASGVFGAGTHTIACTAGTLTLTVSGAVNDADFRLSTDANLPYQWVNTATDYDAGPAFPRYLRCDGVDDAMTSVGNVDFSTTDRLMAVAGTTALSDGPIGNLVCRMGDYHADYCIYVNRGKWSAFQCGNLDYSDTSYVENSVGKSLVIGSQFDLVDSVVKLRINSIQVSQNTKAVGGGGFGNTKINLFRYGSGGRYLNGRFYGLILRGGPSTLTQIEAAETYMRGRMKL